jgi:low affinity Fe/Cu permease
MLILQIAIGVVLGAFLLAYIGELLVLGLSAIVLIIALWLTVIIGFYLFESITSNVAIAIIALIVVCFIFLKIYLRSNNHQKILRERIAKRELLGYDVSDLKVKLKELEDEDASILHHDVLAKERERRRSLGYDK